MANGNGPRFIDSLTSVVSHPLGKILLALLVWSISMAYATGTIRAEVSSIQEQLQKVERQVADLDRYVRSYTTQTH